MPDQTPAPLTDDELREIAANGWAPQGARLATELLAARAEIGALRNDLKAKGSDFDAACRHLGQAEARIAELEEWRANAETTLAEDARYIHEANSGELVRRLGDERDALRARVAELEAQQGEPIGYMVAHTSHDGATSFGRSHYGRRANAEAHVARLGSAWRVIELREVSDRGE
ncbi:MULTISPECIES: hypothetical protein [Nocardia]|uniref:hypothetical protein n=1 Tax=Nocardia TaxID=1817 RepID=UPI002453C027|nr:MULTISPECIES: hypothetical protein [Nocardia]